MKLEEGIILLHIIITGYIQSLEKVFVKFFRFYVHIQSVLINLLKTGYQIVLHQLNLDMPVLITFTITKHLNVTIVGL